jgi:uncharacterized membrane protein
VPDPRFGAEGKQRSMHNNYITLPVVFLMLSNHYPVTYVSQAAIPAIVALSLVAGALVRWFYNRRHAAFDAPGHGGGWWAWGAAGAAIVAAIAVSLALAPSDPEAERAAPRASVPPAVEEIVLGRCSMCHMPSPVWAGIGLPPKGVVLDEPGAILRQKAAIRRHAVLTHAMPPANITGITAEERRVLAAWVAR